MATHAVGPHVCHQLSSSLRAGWLLAGGSSINIHQPSLSASQLNKSEGWKCQRVQRAFVSACFRLSVLGGQTEERPTSSQETKLMIMLNKMKERSCGLYLSVTVRYELVLLFVFDAFGYLLQKC